MSLADANTALNSNGKPFQKAPGSEMVAYDDLGLHLEFDAECLVFVEAFEPCKPTLKGVYLIRNYLSEVVADLRALGLEGQRDEGGYLFGGVGFGLYAPDPNGPVEAASVYAPGYYD